MNQAQAARQEQHSEPAANDPERERVEPEDYDMAGDADVGELEHDSSSEEDQDWDDEAVIRERAVEALSRVRQRIRQQPLTAATGAFILGFAVGNGVPKFLARAGIAVGLRLVMQRMFDRAELFADQD